MAGMCEIYRLDNPEVVVKTYRGSNAATALGDYWFSRHRRNPQTGCLEATGSFSKMLLTAIFDDGVYGARVKPEPQHRAYDGKAAEEYWFDRYAS